MQDVAKGTSFVGQKWAKDYKNALDLDLWGQFEEARESYDKLARSMTVELSSPQSTRWDDRDNENIEKLAICLVTSRIQIDDLNDFDLSFRSFLTFQMLCSA
jgi:hypothetical protein